MTIRKGLIILANLTDQDLIWLSQKGTLLHLRPGDALIDADQEIDNLYVVTDGWLDIRVDAVHVADAGTGDILGEMSFVEKRPTSATVIARTEARALAVPRSALLREFKTNPAFAARFYRALAVFLSDRLRSMTAGTERSGVDEGILERIHVAGDRVLRLVELLEGRVATS